MSRSEVLIKFNRTGNIYYGCNDNCVDMLSPILVNTKTCPKYPGFDFFTELEKEKQSEIWNIDKSVVTDIDTIEVYIVDYDYYFESTGSELLGLILDARYDDTVHIKGEPNWATNFYRIRGANNENY